jgi:hypothetical protein
MQVRLAAEWHIVIQNKLVCLYMVSSFRLGYYLQVRLVAEWCIVSQKASVLANVEFFQAMILHAGKASSRVAHNKVLNLISGQKY